MTQKIPCTGVFANPPYSIPCDAGSVIAYSFSGWYALAAENSVTAVRWDSPEGAGTLDFAALEGADLFDITGATWAFWRFDNDNLPEEYWAEDGDTRVLEYAPLTALDDGVLLDVDRKTGIALSLNSEEDGLDLQCGPYLVTSVDVEIQDDNGAVVGTDTLAVSETDGVMSTGLPTGYVAGDHRVFVTATTPVLTGWKAFWMEPEPEEQEN